MVPQLFIFVQKEKYLKGAKLWAQVKTILIPYTNGTALH